MYILIYSYLYFPLMIFIFIIASCFLMSHCSTCYRQLNLFLALTTIRQCYDGTRRSPWNEIECGDYYARAMAAFLYFEIATGQVDLTSIKCQ